MLCIALSEWQKKLGKEIDSNFYVSFCFISWHLFSNAHCSLTACIYMDVAVKNV